ncbi:uncharacterized protein TRAVEDRAFT_54684 [Trametes versicolor FP-101664 SS1]|uniref:Uncharacterized protein n=1 Tax=Trametes versicolor (strain FP-101664) TaxID=717944 RepID=R7S681_TRAVS|nr:uncharacterized protein TRAVEDRAFT_54684 [Trametes versicolor FP-101664 SS1]EIW51296.1 hypothetical protein TRAVEDRAFT_54684 [Trametes versicolor FP-101664 SS1]
MDSSSYKNNTITHVSQTPAVNAVSSSKKTLAGVSPGENCDADTDVNPRKPLTAILVSGMVPSGVDTDYQAVLDLYSAIEEQRIEFWGKLHLPKTDQKRWARELLRLTARLSATSLSNVRGQLQAAVAKAYDLDPEFALLGQLDTIIQSLSDNHYVHAELINLFRQVFRGLLPMEEGDLWHAKLELLRDDIDRCRAEGERARSELLQLQPLLHFLNLSQVELEKAFRSLPGYRSNGRLTRASKTLASVAYECKILQRRAATGLREKLLKKGTDCASLCDDMWIQSDIQSRAFEIIQAEVEAARRGPDDIRTPLGVFSISDVIRAPSTYQSLQDTIDLLHKRQIDLLIKRKRASIDIVDALM